MVDPRAPDLITHTLADIIWFRLLMIGAGYEGGNDASSLRSDPMFKMALDLSPSERELCSQSTISRLENLPDARALLRMGRAMVDLYCESFPTVPKRIVLDVDDTFDAVHGDQQLRLFNAHYDEYGFQPIVVFDGEGRFVTAVLRPAKRPGGKEIRAFLRWLLRAIRANWPNTEILLRADSHYCCPEVLDWCRAKGLDFIFGVAPTPTLRRHIERPRSGREARFDAAPRDGKVRRFKEFFDGAKSWSRVERIIARVEAGTDGPDTRFIVTNLKVRNARVLYEDVYCRRGQAENHIKSWEDISGRRPHVLHEGYGQSVATVPARGRLLAHVGLARVDAETFDVACRAVRHVAPAARQTRRPRRRDEDDDPRFICRHHVPLRIFCVSRSPASRASSLEKRGVAPLERRTRPVNPQTFSHPLSGSQPKTTPPVRGQPQMKKTTPTRRQRWRKNQCAAQCGLIRFSL